MFNLELSYVPLYGQEQCTWCGAASGQMAMNGYPDPTHRMFFSQQDIWNSIQVHNSTAPADAGWATDPFGLRDCMMAMNPPSLGWDVFANPSRNSIMFSILYWMNRLKYPAPVLINQGGHWVVIVGFDTDVEPLSASSPTLSNIHFHDPEPHNVGTDTMIAAGAWYGSQWSGPVFYSGTWLNQYVAVIEPPTAEGHLKVLEMKRIGEKLISPKEALEHAQRWIRELGLAERPRYALLKHADLQALEPIVVREEKGFGEPEKRTPHYYIVPFGLKREAMERGAGLARVCVVVNAYTGEFEEVTTFGKPVRYLPKEEALSVVARGLHLRLADLQGAQATLMFKPSDITHIRVYPFWEVKFKDRIIYVDQLGKLYGKLIPSIPGD